jgi:toxin ParE1/3/4
VTGRRYTVVWTEVAVRDIERLAIWLVNDAQLRADRILERIIARAQSLDPSPERGRTPPELRPIGDRTWREVQDRPWRIIYRVEGKTVQIHGVLDGRRNLDDVLLERMLDA